MPTRDEMETVIRYDAVPLEINLKLWLISRVALHLEIVGTYWQFYKFHRRLYLRGPILSQPESPSINLNTRPSPFRTGEQHPTDSSIVDKYVKLSGRATFEAQDQEDQ